MENVPESHLAGIGASPPCFTEVKKDGTVQKFDATWAFIAFYSFQQSFKGILWYYTDIQTKNFISNSTFSLVKNIINNGVQSKNVSDTSETVLNLVSYSNVPKNVQVQM